MPEFDTYKINKEEAVQIPEFDPGFTDVLNLVTEYDEDYCNEIIKFARQGNFIFGFCGQYNICSNTMYNVWLNREDKTYSKFRSAVKTAQSALFSYYNKKLVHAINNPDTLGSTIAVLRSILADLMKDTPKAIRDLQFEDIEEGETPEQKKDRLENERKQKELQAFRGAPQV